MKPQDKTVTLIGLDGNPICRYVEGKTEIYYVAPHKGVYDGCLVVEPTGVNSYGEKHTLKPLMEFLQDQLTFIRNGMWETLAIYQATLGRYTEVPWYRLSIDCLRETKQMGKLIKLLDNNNVEATGFYQFGGIESPIFNAENVKGLEYETVRVSLDYFKAWKPNYNDFIQYYHDIFSKLTPEED